MNVSIWSLVNGRDYDIAQRDSKSAGVKSSRYEQELPLQAADHLSNA
jgi:hypothetical protein